MNVNIEELSSIKRKMTIEVPAEDAAKIKNKHLDQISREAAIKGFRPGKAPKSMVAKIYAERIQQAVIEDLVSERLPKALEEKGVEPVGMPALEGVSSKDGEPYRFEIVFDIMPVFPTPAWRGLGLSKEKYEITDEQVDANLDKMRLELSTVKPIEEDRELRAEDDIAVVEYQGFENGEPVEGIKSGRFQIEMGQGRSAPEFENALPGMKKGDVRDVPMTFPAEAQDKKIAGKTLAMRTTLHEIKVRELPALDDELARDLDWEGVETLEALRARIRENLVEAAEKRVDQEFNKQLTDKLAALVQIEVPEVMVARETRNMLEGLKNNFRRSGLDFQRLGMDEKRLEEDYRPKAVNAVRAALVLEQIGKDENIEVADEDIDKELADMSEHYGQPVETIREFHEKNELMGNLRHSLRVEKTLRLIKDQAQVIEVDPPAPKEEGETQEEQNQ